MIIVTFGSDTYGRVKRVGATSVITRFWMLQCLPLFPLESYYYARRGDSTSDVISSLIGADAATARAVPLAKIDKLSVAMAYFRGLCGAIAIVGCISLVPAIMHFSGERLDRVAIMFTQVLVSCLIVGTTGGVLSYCLPRQATNRQKRIRRACGEVLGMCADPASFRRDAAEAMEVLMVDGAEYAQLQAPGRSSGTDVLFDLRLQLATTRLQIALDGPRQSLELRTNELLEGICRAAKLNG